MDCMRWRTRFVAQWRCFICVGKCSECHWLAHAIRLISEQAKCCYCCCRHCTTAKRKKELKKMKELHFRFHANAWVSTHKANNVNKNRNNSKMHITYDALCVNANASENAYLAKEKKQWEQTITHRWINNQFYLFNVSLLVCIPNSIQYACTQLQNAWKTSHRGRSKFHRNYFFFNGIFFGNHSNLDFKLQAQSTKEFFLSADAYLGFAFKISRLVGWTEVLENSSQ